MKGALAAAFLFLSVAWGKEKCELSQNALMKYEQRILVAADQFARHHDAKYLLQITKPLACVLDIQEKSDGQLKYFANSFLRPVLGGPQTRGMPPDPRYKIVARELNRISEHANLLDNSVMAAHSRGAWGFYSLFCEQGNVEFCTTFLPSDEQIKIESPLLAVSSMLMLRKAFYVLNGKQKAEIAERIKQLYKVTPSGGGLKRRMIEQIYSELFAAPTPLSLLS